MARDVRNRRLTRRNLAPALATFRLSNPLSRQEESSAAKPHSDIPNNIAGPSPNRKSQLRASPPSRPELSKNIPNVLPSRLSLHRPLLHHHLRRRITPPLPLFRQGTHSCLQPPRKVDSAHELVHHRCHRHCLGLHLPLPTGAATQLSPDSALVPWWLPWRFVGLSGA